MTDEQQLAARRARRFKLALDLGVLLGVALFIFGLYLLKPYLAPLIGGLLIAAGCYFAGYDQLRRSRD